jgi:predicted NAD/FAD-binding protein
MARKRVAIIGTGIAGLGCAHFLQSECDLTLLDGGAHVGGHSHTVDVSEAGRSVAFDTGFMVFNRVTYPRLTRLFRELEVPVKPTEMSFSVQHRPSGLEYCGSSLNRLFAQRRNLWNGRFIRMLRQVARFNEEAVAALENPEWASLPLEEYVRQRGYGDDFLNLYLIPMSGAVWSTPPALMLRFPAASLLRFFHNHGFLGLHTQHPWWTVEGGSREYVKRLAKPMVERFRMEDPVVSVRRLAVGAEVQTRSGWRGTFDWVVLAAHADQSLNLLIDADPEERRLLGEFRYQPNEAVVHTDESVMPRARMAWSAWNYRMDAAPGGAVQTQTVYWMNALQGVSDRKNYFVSINPGGTVAEDQVVRRIAYEHPLFTLGAVQAQAGLPGLNRRAGASPVVFCGSYFRYGFHEDAFSSGLDAAEVVLGRSLGWARAE